MADDNQFDDILESALSPSLDVVIQGELISAITGNGEFNNLLINRNGLIKTISELVTLLTAEEGFLLINDIWNLIASEGIARLDTITEINDATDLDLDSIINSGDDIFKNINKKTTSGRNVFQVISELTIHLLAVIPQNRCQELMGKAGFIYKMLGKIMPKELVTYLQFLITYPGNLEEEFLKEVIIKILSELNEEQVNKIMMSDAKAHFAELRRFAR